MIYNNLVLPPDISKIFFLQEYGIMTQCTNVSYFNFMNCVKPFKENAASKHTLLT